MLRLDCSLNLWVNPWIEPRVPAVYILGIFAGFYAPAIGVGDP